MIVGHGWCYLELGSLHDREILNEGYSDEQI